MAALLVTSNYPKSYHWVWKMPWSASGPPVTDLSEIVPPIVEAIIGLTVWGAVLLLGERWEQYCGRRDLVARPEPHQPTSVADEAERWLTTENEPGALSG